MTTVPQVPHPFGNDYASCVRQWELIATFTDPNEPLARIARLALWAAAAPDDVTMRTRAMQVLGLDGSRKTSNNLQRLRVALQDLSDLHRVAYPQPDDDDDDDEAGNGNPAPLTTALKDGVTTWLYERVKGSSGPGVPEQRQFLKRTAATDAQTRESLKWALTLKPAAPPALSSRGRVR